MFSVNNFYEVFNSHYGWPQKNNNLWVFDPHGSKDWMDITIFGPGPNGYNAGAIIMHDQEPFFKESIDLFKLSIESGRKPVTSWGQSRFGSVPLEEIKLVNSLHALLWYIRSSEMPIICHSEKNSQDIAFLEDNQFVPCYYWWHGMVARDWFRHWERHAGLQVYNKSNAAHRFVFYCRAEDGTRAYRKKVKKELQHCSAIQSDSSVSSDSSAVISVSDANNSAIHIVAETLFDTDKIYLTEKVFKPMVMSQPFILFAAPGSLQYLRDYGFKTFDTVWSEEYDTILDAAERKDYVIRLIHQLQRLPQQEFSDLYQKSLPIIKHNRERFFSVAFQDMLWQELTNNMDYAQEKQCSLKESYPGGTDLMLYHRKHMYSAALTDAEKRMVGKISDSGVVKKDWVLRRYPVFQDLL